jgi:hypothetical protein
LTCCFLGILALFVFEPMALLPYWCRTIRIYTIFKAQEYYFQNKKKPNTGSWFRWIREPVLFRFCLIIISAFSLVALIGFGLFVGANDSNMIDYLPSYTVYMCFMQGICGDESADM